MDSNRNIVDQHHENLQGSSAIEKIRSMVESTKTCFFCTSATIAGSSGARPMSVQEVDAEGNLWFLSGIDTHKDQELKIDPRVQLYFQGSAHGDFLEINGHGSVSQDPVKIDHLWRPIMKNWFTEGREDPRISVIKVTPVDGYYWETKHGFLISGVKILLGSVTGNTSDDSREGELRV
jgi:general stress protein 26